MAVRVRTSRLRKDRDDVFDETELGFLPSRSRQRGREQDNGHAGGHRELSSVDSIFNSIGGDTASPARSRNDFTATGPAAFTRNSIWLEPGASTLFSNFTPASPDWGSSVRGVVPPSKRWTRTLRRATLPGVSVRVCGGSS